MASRIQQDTFMDESDDSCPLCVEEFDLSDKSFRPCPCGYQVCQFCYNNIKNNMNGLCPACRRPYDEQSIEWKVISPEEAKADKALQDRKKALAKQKESERKNVETLNRKHLAGLRVVQKNLVYVVGLNPKSREQDLLQTLRGDQYFGQYGKIIKIVVGRGKEGQNSNSIGVYVTFARKEDAASCISAVDGSHNGDRLLRAQYGTTKYCSAFLRNENCNNRSCMFLHETGEDDDSFSRQDLSSMNASSAQRPTQSSTSRPTQQVPQAPPQQAPQAVSAASHSMARQGSRDEAMSRSDSGDGSALPSTASWATRTAQNESRRSSKPGSVSAPSPVVTSATAAAKAASVAQPATQTTMEAPPAQAPSDEEPAATTEPSPKPRVSDEIPRYVPREPSPTPGARAFERVMQKAMNSSFKFQFDRSIHSEETLREIDCYPLLFDCNRGLQRHRQDKEREEELRQQEEQNALRTLSISDDDDNPASGSLQLGGEPDTQEDQNPRSGRGSSEPRSAIQPPLGSMLHSLNPLSTQGFLGNNPSSIFSNGRSFTPQQQQQLQTLRSSNNQQSPFTSQPQSTFTSNTSMHHHQQSNPFQNQGFGSIPGHSRQASRYAFANDTASNASTIKPSSNIQQPGILSLSQTKQFSGQPFQQSSGQNQPFYSGVQGPPPGLKSSGTPPVSGGGMFGQGHGFASAMGGSLGLGNSNGASKDTNEELMRELLRGRNGNVGGQGHDVGKRESKFLSFPSSMASNTAPASSLLNPLYGAQPGTYNGYQDHGLQKQKKKGKKHRHANTSSSGGGGLVNLADPSILQARMHHGGAGQGQFGVQGQGSRILPQLQNLTSVDTPSNNKTIEAIGSIGGKVPAKEPTKTESPIPPGLSLPQDFPPLAAPSRPPPLARKVTQIATPSIKPAIPVLHTSKGQPSTAAKDEQSGSSTIELDPRAETKEAVPSTFKAAVKVDAAKDSEAVEATSSHSKRDNVGISTSDATVRPAVDTGPKPKKVHKTGDKRPLPRKLDIAATKDSSKSKVHPTATSSKAQTFTESSSTPGRVNESADSRPDTPTKALPHSAQSAQPITPRTGQPRTLRVVPTTKADNTARPAVASSPVPESATTTPAGLHSRRLSLTSLQGPTTPRSEKISDNASLTSTSLSRANSPPPTKAGTAPVRQHTKNQQKKERQARAREVEKLKADEAPIRAVVEEPVVQAPIIGRKKKTKKITASRGTADSTPAVTRPSSPTHQEALTEEKMPSLPATPVRDLKKDTKHETSRAEAESPATPDTPATFTQPEQPKPSLSAASIFASLQKSGEVPTSYEGLFRSVAGMNYRYDITNADFEDPPIPALTDEQIQALDAGEAQYVELANKKPVIVMPDGQELRGLTKEQATRYLKLRTSVMQIPDYLRWLALSEADVDRLQLHRPPPAVTSNALATTEDGPELVNRFIDSPETLAYETQRMQSPAMGVWHPEPQNTKVKSVKEAEEEWNKSKKEHEAIEKRMNNLLKKNRRLTFGGGH